MSIFDGPITGVGPAVSKTEPFTVVDDLGLVHLARTFVRPVYGGHGNIHEEDMEATECLIELERAWRREDGLVVTCLECAVML